MLALAGGRVGLVLAEAAHRRVEEAGPSRATARGRDRHRPDGAAFRPLHLGAERRLFGLIAVVRFGTPSASALKEGGRSSSDGPARHRTRNALVVSQVALALDAAGRLGTDDSNLRRDAPGRARLHATRRRSRRSASRSRTPSHHRSRTGRARTPAASPNGCAQVPGVASVGLASSITMDGEDNTNPLFVEDAPVAGRAAPAVPALQERRARVFRDDGQPLGRRTLHHLDRDLRAAAGGRRFRARSRASTGRNHRERSASACAAVRESTGTRSSAWSAMSATTA